MSILQEDGLMCPLRPTKTSEQMQHDPAFKMIASLVAYDAEMCMRQIRSWNPALKVYAEGCSLHGQQSRHGRLRLD